MADYNRVKIATIYLTDTGLVDGLPCRCEVTGLDRLKPTKTGAIQLAADGTPHVFPTGNLGRGVGISIRPYLVMKDVFDSVVTAINAALTAGTAVNITIAGDTGNFDLDCYPAIPQPIEFPGTFSDGRIDGVQFNFVVSGVN